MLVDQKDPANKTCLRQDPLGFRWLCHGFASIAYKSALVKCMQHSETGEDTCYNAGSRSRAYRSSDRPWLVSNEVR